jgi:hypothetical protein
MIVYVLSFAVFVLVLSGLSVGLIAGRGGIRGTCGGLNDPDGHGCGACGRSASSPTKCPRKRAT